NDKFSIINFIILFVRIKNLEIICINIEIKIVIGEIGSLQCAIQSKFIVSRISYYKIFKMKSIFCYDDLFTIYSILTSQYRRGETCFIKIDRAIDLWFIH